MKITESNTRRVEGFSEWIDKVQDLHDSDFLIQLQTLQVWPWAKLDDLLPAISILNRIDDLLSNALKSSDNDGISFLLDFTILLLSNTHSKWIYNSLDLIQEILEIESIHILYKALKVAYLVGNRLTPNMRMNRSLRRPELNQKLFVIAMGYNINSSRQVSFDDLTNDDPIPPIPFQYVHHDQVSTDFQQMPPQLQFAYKNRLRFNEALLTKESRSTMLCCQFIALSTLLQSGIELNVEQDLQRSLPDLWLFAYIPRLLAKNLSPELHSEIINMLSAVLVLQDNLQQRQQDSPYGQLVKSVNNLIASWQQHGLLQSLLRDITSPSPSTIAQGSAKSPEFVRAIVQLSSLVADYKFRIDSAHVSGMTASLLQIIIQSQSYQYELTSLTNAVRTLSVLVSHQIDMFKEMNGLQITLDIVQQEIQIFLDKTECQYAQNIGGQVQQAQRPPYIRSLLRLVKIAVTKWNSAPGIAAQEIQLLSRSLLFQKLKFVFQQQLFEIFEPSLTLMITLINENPPIILELLQMGLLQALLESLETNLPSQPKLLAVITKLLCSISLIQDGVALLQQFQTVTRVLKALGSNQGAILSNDLAFSIAESMQDLLGRAVDLKQSTVIGCVELIKSLNGCDLTKKEAFFTQLTNIGKLLSVLFGYSTELIRGFVNEGGLDAFLDLFKLPILPMNYTNDFHSVLSCFKSLPNNQGSVVILRVLQQLDQALNLIEEQIGQLDQARVLNIEENKSERLLQCLTQTDSFAEMLRLLLSNGIQNDSQVVDLLNIILRRLGKYLKVLIAEQARLSIFSKPGRRKSDSLNVQIDIKEIESADLKSFEENFLFTCQLGIRKLLRLVSRVPNQRGRFMQQQNDTPLALGQQVGNILSELTNEFLIDDLDQEQAYYLCLMLSDIVKVLIYEQATFVALYAFHRQGGTQNIIRFLMKLKDICFSIVNQQEFEYDLVNSIQILWSLGGKLLEGIAHGKFTGLQIPGHLLQHWGIDDQKEIVKQMQYFVILSIKELSFLQIGKVSQSFARSVIEILKSMSEFATGNDEINENSVQSLMDMGFSQQVARHALMAIRSSSVEAAMDYILNHPQLINENIDSDNQQRQIQQIYNNIPNEVLSSLPFLPFLASQVSDLISRIGNRNSQIFQKAGLELINMSTYAIGVFIQDQGIINRYQDAWHIEDQPNLTHLQGLISVLNSLSGKNADVLQIVKEQQFIDVILSLFNYICQSGQDANYSFVQNCICIMDKLFIYHNENGQRIIESICQLLIANGVHYKFIEMASVQPLLALLQNLCEQTQLAKYFLDSNALASLVLLRNFQNDTRSRGIVQQYAQFLRLLIEDPHYLYSSFMIQIIQQLQGQQQLSTFLAHFKQQINRNKDIFQAAFNSVCNNIKRNGECYAELKEQIVTQEFERWNTIEHLTYILGEIYEIEQQQQETLILSSDNFVMILADELISYPKLIKQMMAVPLTLKDYSKGKSTTNRFINHLIRTIIPNRYTLRVKEDKIVFHKPNTEHQIQSQQYQDWIKIVMRLIKSLCFKQHYRQFKQQALDIFNNNVIDNNIPVLKARKRIFNEMKDILSKLKLKHWFSNEKAISQVRTVAIITMQLLREQPKAPFIRQNVPEIAKMIISDKFQFVKLLSEISRGVKLSFPKSQSVLNLLLAPLELLTRYHISFTLRQNKPESIEEQKEDDDIISESNPEDFQDIIIGQISGDEAYFSQVYSNSQSGSYSDDVESSGEDLIDDQEDLLEEEDEEMEDDEDIFDDDESVFELEDDEDNMHDIIIESRASENFWADDLDDEVQEEPAHNRLDRFLLNEERQHNLGIIGQEIDDLHHGNTFTHLNIHNAPHQFGRFLQFRGDRNISNVLGIGQDDTQIIELIRAERNDDDIVQFLIQRQAEHRESQQVDRNPPRHPNNDNTFDEFVYQQSIQAEEVQQEQLLNEQIPNLILPPLVQSPEQNFENILNQFNFAQIQSPNQELQQSPQSPNGIDPGFLEALPEDIRAEVLAQHRHPTRPPTNEQISEDFLDALPPEIRAEVMGQNQSQRAPQDIDNATFVASLTPDLRREILLTANEEFLASLPPELVAEAQMLQERAVRNHHQALLERRIPEPIRREEEGKELQDVVQDEKLAMQLLQVEDSFMEVLLKALYLINTVNKDIYSSLILNLSAHPVQRQKIIDSLLALLKAEHPKHELPPKKLLGSENLTENYKQVYGVVSARILDILQYIAKINPKVSTDMLSPTKHRLPAIHSFIGQKQTIGINELFNYLNKDLFKKSVTHIASLTNLILTVLKQGQVPELGYNEIQQLCNILNYDNLTEETVKSIIQIVSRLAENPKNSDLTREFLTAQVDSLGQEISQLLTNVQTSYQGKREILLLRLCKVLQGINGQFQCLSQLWIPLTNALQNITRQESEISTTTDPTLSKILPVIEAFFLSNQEQDQIFNEFCDSNRKVLNILVKQNLKLLNDTFNSLVTRFPYLLDFDNKKNYFRQEMHKLRPDRHFDNIRLSVRRNQVFMDSYHQLRVRKAEEMYGKIRVQFVGEEGMDAGGLSREWYSLLAREMFNPNYALFIQAANGVSFQPNPMSYVNSEHLQFFKFIGRIISKALCDSQHLEVYFTRSFYKHILNQEVTYQDMEDLDPTFYKNLKYLLEINLDENPDIEFYFSVEESEFGVHKVKDLIPDGRNIRVNESNKMDYIQHLCEMKMTRDINAQINSFLEGFYELIPKQLISIFDNKELELLISGLPEIDIADLRNNTTYTNYNKETPVIQWLWEILFEFSQEDRAAFIQFVTGSSKVPLEGFKALPGMGGVQKFQIHKAFADDNRLPTAHTCMNQLDLPEYPSKEILFIRLKMAISEGREGFGFA